MKIEFQGTDSVNENIDEKLKSPFWGSMVLTWLTWNWDVWYTTIFVSEELTGNKVIYIKEMYNYFDVYGLFPCLGILFHWIIMPLLLSIFIIKIVTPHISLWFKKQHRNNKIEENKIKIEEYKSEKEVSEAEEKKIEQEQKVEKKKEKSQEEKWDEEYETVINKYPNFISQINKLIYEMYGATKYGNSYNNTKFDIKWEQILNSLELIDKDNTITPTGLMGGNFYKLTTKGKYFIKKSTLSKH